MFFSMMRHKNDSETEFYNLSDEGWNESKTTSSIELFDMHV